MRRTTVRSYRPHTGRVSFEDPVHGHAPDDRAILPSPGRRAPSRKSAAAPGAGREPAYYCPSKTYCTTDCNRPGSALKSRSWIGTEYEATTSSTVRPAACPAFAASTMPL